MNLSSLLKPLASLRLTVVCLGLGMLVVFAATLEQVNLGIHAVQEKYFQSWLALWNVPGLAALTIPLPGGYLLGGVLLVNLFAAHFTRFQLSWKKAGIFMIHAGIILLLLGELFTGLFAIETRLRFDEGESRTYSEASREVELAVIDTSGSEREKVVAIPEGHLEKGGVIQHPALPFTIHIQKFMGNSRLVARSEVPNAPPSPATTGVGVQIHATELPRATKLNERDLTTVFAELRSGGESLGTWLLSNQLRDPQSFRCDGRTWKLAVRQRRDYKPFSLKLIDFTHDRYAGTEIPKNFSSLVELDNPETGENREILIYMNHPLRYEGYTFYQSGFDNADTTSILQVVRNPAWLMPYIACALVALGLVTQFTFHLLRFGRSRRKSAAAPA